jgi:hypothetical protein
LPHSGTKEVGGGSLSYGLISALFDIHTGIVDGFDDDCPFGLGHIPSPRLEDVVPMLACACDPNNAILALNSHSIFAVIQVDQFTWLKEQLDSWGL